MCVAINLADPVIHDSYALRVPIILLLVNQDFDLI